MSALNGRELSAFVTAFEQAWDEYVATNAPVSTDMYRFREILARHILALTKQCDADEPHATSQIISDRSYRPSAAPTTGGRVLNEVA
jgi:hypothetical protein